MTIIRFGKDVVNGWLAADAFTLAASLAYYAIFAKYSRRHPEHGG